MESADPILSPDELLEWWEAGLRVVGPAHYGPGRYAGGTSTELGLTDLGVALLAKMEWLGMILDLTHLSDQAFWQALEAYQGPVLASHNNCRALVPHQRQFSDDQLKAIFERDGVIGAAFDTWMLQPGWIIGQSTNERSRWLMWLIILITSASWPATPITPPSALIWMAVLAGINRPAIWTRLPICKNWLGCWRIEVTKTTI